MRRIGIICVLLAASLAAGTAAAAAPPRPAGVPRAVPAWAWSVYTWQKAPAASRGARPAAPQRLPTWYWQWRSWRASLAAASRAAASLRPYGGLGSWIDLYDKAAWKNPESAVAALAEHGVRTLFLETSNSNQKADLVDAAALGRFVEAAHAYDLTIVAWYLPTLTAPVVDLRRSRAAIDFRSPAAESFDGFALDIESSTVKSVALRNTRLLTLSDGLRTELPDGYALGAIVPSPVGMQIHPTYWPGFPWAELAQRYAVFVPMAYYTYKPRTAAQVYAYTRDVIGQIREQTGNPEVPIHVVGGIANRTSAAALTSFLGAATNCGALGTSVYDAATSSATIWAGLAGYAPGTGGDC